MVIDEGCPIVLVTVREHPFESVTVAETTPAGKPVAVATPPLPTVTDELLLNTTAYVAVPPAGITEKLPLLPPLQDGCAVAEVAVSEVGCVIVKVRLLNAQPLASRVLKV